ncbi:MAG: OB-fold nucleic acid binding domain-containing protein [Prevotella sp.]|nr:OB-fold nucleic acid binding domain-containing protein [Prevotella sp.]MBQ6210376.1 OB-fold nucleic acid binding domain-containing protein [Prevotella sp.]
MKKLFYSLFALAMTAMTFTSCEDVPMPYDDPTMNQGGGNTTVIDPTGTGTQDDPFNVIAAINYAQQLELGEESDKDIYIKGVVVSIAENYTLLYGNARFYISDDGTAKNQLLIYRALYLGNRKYTDGDLLQEGDSVIICGKVTNYNGTLETAQNKAYLYSLNGQIVESSSSAAGDPTGTGTLEDPFNSVAAMAFCEELGVGNESDKDYYIKGKVATITENYSTQYGNAQFTISDDGTAKGQFLIYRALYLGNKKYTEGDLLKEGDEVIVCGRLTNYNGTAETAQNKAYLYSLNGVTGGDTPTPSGEAKGSGTLEDPFNAVAANNYASSLAADAKSDKDVYIKGKISSIANNGAFGTQYGNATFYISDDGTSNNEFYVFRTLYLGNKKYDNTNDPNINVGDEVIICGKVTNYRGNTPETSANESYIYSLNGKTEGGGGEEQPKDAGTYDSPLTVTQAISLANADAAWVKGYIVGYVTGQVISTGAVFSAEGATNTNLLIAASASETDVSKCMPIQLSRDYRADFALDANPGMLGKEVIIAGQLTTYFGVPGLKSPTYIEANGKSVGNKVKFRKR